MIHRSVTVSRVGTKNSAKDNRQERGAAAARRTAEWTTLGVSATILLGLCGYLIYEAATPDPPFIPVRTKALLDQVHRMDNRFVLPVEVTNPGRKTVTNLKVELRSGSGDLEVDIDLDYVGQHSNQTVYAILDKDPRTTPITVNPRIYSVE